MQLGMATREYLDGKLDIMESSIDLYITTLIKLDRDKDLNDIVFHMAEILNKIGYVKSLLEHYETPVSDDT